MVPMQDEGLDPGVGNHGVKVEEDDYVASMAVQPDAAELGDGDRV